MGCGGLVQASVLAAGLAVELIRCPPWAIVGNPCFHGGASAGTGVPWADQVWCGVATVMSNSTLLAGSAQTRPLLDRQVLATLIAGSLLILISFTTNYSYGDFHHFSSLAIDEQIGVCLYAAALAALFGDVELATRLRHRARNREIEARGREAE
jgi:hypothetical protein